MPKGKCGSKAARRKRRGEGSAGGGSVVDIEARLARRRFEREHPIESEYTVTIMRYKGGIFGFRFDGIELAEDNIWSAIFGRSPTA